MAFSYVASQNLTPMMTKLQESRPRVCSMAYTLFGNKRLRLQISLVTAMIIDII